MNVFKQIKVKINYDLKEIKTTFFCQKKKKKKNVMN